jgi:hypothetical protein
MTTLGAGQTELRSAIERRRFRPFVCISAKKDPRAALSAAVPAWPPVPDQSGGP